MIKKILITLISTLMINSYADVSDKNFIPDDDFEIINYEKKMNHIKLGDTLITNKNEIIYDGKKWYYIESFEDKKYYIMKDPESNKISRIRIVYPYSEFETGRDIKNLKLKFGDYKIANNKIFFETSNQKISLVIEKDVLDEKDQLEKTIIDIMDRNLTILKKESENRIYREGMMIRHK